MRFKLIAVYIAMMVLWPSHPGIALDAIGLSHPESIVMDPHSGSYYISNINGSPLDYDNNGFVTKIDKDGLVVVLRFIASKTPVNEEVETFNTQLNAPKGMVIIDGVLYIADLNAVRGYYLESGSPKVVVDLREFEPQYLNDITSDDEGNLYVSDMDGNQIFKIKSREEYQVEVFASGEELNHPNGLLFDVHRNILLAATWNPGGLIEINPNGEIIVIKKGLANLDGIVMDRRGNVFVSSYTNGEIYKITKRGRGKLSLFQTGLKTPADISLDPKSDDVLVPLMMDNRVTSFDLNE